MSGMKQTAMCAPGAERPIGVDDSRVDSLCSQMDDDLRADEKRSPFLGLLCILALWVLSFYVGVVLIRTLS